ncbi:MAG: adenosine deaminase [Pseudomonadota bacterium]
MQNTLRVWLLMSTLVASAGVSGTERTESVQAFLLELPKTELHIHLEGTIEPEDYLALVEKNNLKSPYATADAVRERLTYQKDLNTFIEVYEELLSALVTTDDFEQAIVRYAGRVAAQGVVYVEMFFDPQMHTSRGIPLEQVMAGLQAGKARAAAEHGVEVWFIACFNRNRTAESAMAHLEQLTDYRDLVIAVGLDNPEVIDFPSKFAAVFARAAELDFRRTTHLDVNVPNTLAHHHDSISLLGVERIDHGLNVIDDPALVKTVQDKSIGLAACVTLLYRHVPGEAETLERLEDRFGRMRQLLDAGVVISLNSDDPGLMSSLYVGDLYVLGYREGYLSLQHLVALARNGFEIAWMDDEAKAGYLERFADFLVRNLPDS